MTEEATQCLMLVQNLLVRLQLITLLLVILLINFIFKPYLYNFNWKRGSNIVKLRFSDGTYDRY